MPIIKKQVPKIQCTNHDDRINNRDFTGLVEELYSEDSTARRWAVRDLAEMPDVSSVLVDRLVVENNAGVRTAILNALAHLGDDVAIAGLVHCLRSEEAALRNEAIGVLKESPNEVEPIISTLLTDSDSDVRIFAVNILESLRHKNVEQWLLNVIEKDSHLNVCATAVDLLSEVGSERSIPALKQLKIRFEDEPYICFSVDLALKRIEEGSH
ncbi:MAG: HEAT repeat domain-containing protein [Methylococcales bacterium]|nr:HEAT repeat domain-containing protein [Methylococcales bacterium]MDD5755104.1 HEAT repeat domain-containing protein [Methylococcales bacterium]